MKRVLEIAAILLFVGFVSLAESTGWATQLCWFLALCAAVALLSLFQNKD